MKISRHLFALLAFSALSTNAAVARHHHGHHAGGGNATANTSGTGTLNQAKPPTAIGGQPGSAPATDGGGPDHVNADSTGKGPTDPSGQQSKIGVVPAPGTSVNAQGRFHAVLPGGAQESGPGAEIDTRITVHQGRNAPKNNSKTLKAAIGPGRTIVPGTASPPTNPIAPVTNVGHRRAHDQHQKPPGVANGVPQRNAIGAVVDKSVKPGNTSPIGAAAPINTSTAAPTTNSAPPPGAGAMVHDPKPPINPPSGATQIGNHAAGSTALAIVTTSGPSINGTGMIRPGSGTGAVGGAAKIASGVVSGSSFRPKHP